MTGDLLRRVRAAQAGDRAAFGLLVGQYQDMVYGLCLRLSASRHDAEDLAHDAFVEAFLKLGQLEAPERFGGWLRALALNVCRMWLRRGRGAASFRADPVPVSDDETTAACARIAPALPDLDEDHRRVLVLHYWEGMSCRQMAAWLEVPVSTVLSRLHRARQALRQAVGDDDAEELTMTPDEAFGRTIDAEIGVLLRLFPEQPESAARLRQILEQDPGRLAHLLGQPDEETQEALGLLLGRLGRPAIEAALACCFEGPEPVRARAVGLLRDLVAAGRQPERPAGGEYGRHPLAAREGYLIADRLLAGPWERPAQVALLLELLEACAHLERKGGGGEGPANLLTHVLLCYGDEAFGALMARFWQAANRREALAHSWVLHALQRTGPRFGRALLEGLGQSDRRLLGLALTGLDVLLPWDRGWRGSLQGTPEDQWRVTLWLRFGGGYTPLLASQLDADPGLPQELGARLTELMDHPRTEVRHQAIRLLGSLGLPDHLEVMRRLARDGDPDERRMALRALSNAQDAQSLEVFVEGTRAGDAAERRVAIEALGRLRRTEAVPLLAEMCRAGEPGVSEVAAVALGEIGGEEARGILEELLAAPQRDVVRAAANALYAGGRRNRFRDAGDAEAPGRRAQLGHERLQKVRGEARPFIYRSVLAAVCVLPEARAYPERELTYHIAQVVHDWAWTRRYLVVQGVMTRQGGVYEWTDLGQAMWRVEHRIAAHYLGQGEG